MDDDSTNTDAAFARVFDLHSTSNPHQDNQDDQGVSDCTRSLIECSEAEDEVLRTICCNDWQEAAVGWRHTAPCVKYAWSEQPKKQLVGAHGEGKKNRNIIRPKNFTKDFNWRATVEPGTYRYSPSGLHHTITESAPSSDTCTDGDDIHFHIEQVRNHFEKTLEYANRPVKVPRDKKSLQHADCPRKSVSDVAFKELEGDVSTRGRRKSNQLEENPNRCSSMELLQQPAYERQLNLNHMWQQYQVQKVLINNPFHPLDCTHHLKFSHIRRSPPVQNVPLNHQGGDDYHSTNLLTGWGSGFVVEAEPPLNPLEKVTPQQRRVHDDNEATELFPILSSPSGSFWGLYPNVKPLSSKDGRGKTERTHSIPVHPTDPKANAGQMRSAVPSNSSEGKFSLAKELQSIQDILQAQRYSSQEVKRKPERQRHRPHRLRKLTARGGAGDLNLGAGDLGEPLHKGIIDRKTASDLAAELLPGISGQRLERPLCAYRII